MAKLVDKNGNIDYYGKLSWGNFVDWLVTLCLAAILVSVTISLGGIRPDGHAVLLPLFGVLLFLHGLWLAVEKEKPKRLSPVPFLFLPFLAWMVVNIVWISPVPWRGWLELVYTLEVFIFIWVFCNNARTRAHLWLLIICALVPLALALLFGFYQFFQSPGKIAGAGSDYTVLLSPEFLGQTVGVFADPSSFAVFLLILLPAIVIAGIVPRLPGVLRILCLYLAVMMIGTIALTQVFWPLFLVIPFLLVLPFLCFEKRSQRFKFSFFGILLFLAAAVPLLIFYPRFERGFKEAASPQGEGVRLVLWEEAFRIGSSHLVTGAGAGSFGMLFEQSGQTALSRIPETPHNDFLLVFSQYGLIGLLLFGVPVLYVVTKGFRAWRKEAYSLRLKEREGRIMPPNKFFLSLGLAGVFSFGACLFFNFVFYVPALSLYGALFFVILVKSAFSRSVKIPGHRMLRLSYCAISLIAGLAFYNFAAPRLIGQGIELQARERLEQIVAASIQVSGNPAILERTIEDFQRAIDLDPGNADAWIGLSAARSQRFFRNPAGFRELGQQTVSAAESAVARSDNYWLAWAQLGIAHSLAGERKAGEQALAKALELAPNNSNAHYYWAAFVGEFSDRRAEAIEAVERALEINPENLAARRLQQKLRIL